GRQVLDGVPGGLDALGGAAAGLVHGLDDGLGGEVTGADRGEQRRPHLLGGGGERLDGLLAGPAHILGGGHGHCSSPWWGPVSAPSLSTSDPSAVDRVCLFSRRNDS